MRLDLSELKIFSVGDNEMFLPSHFSEEIKQGIAATIVSKIINVKSIDYTLKKYIQQKSKKKNKEILTDKIIREIKLCRKKIQDKFELVKFDDEKVASLAVDTCLIRLNSSYEVCLFLIDLGYYFEANSIIRQIFEQLVFCINICDLSDEEYEKVRNSKNDKTLDTTNLKKIKQLVRDFDVGPIYRDLSQKAHIDISEVYNYIEYDQEIKRVTVIQRSRELTKVSAYLLLIMCYLHEIVQEYSLKDYLEEFNFIEKDGDKYKSIPNTEYRNKLKKFQEELAKEI